MIVSSLYFALTDSDVEKYNSSSFLSLKNMPESFQFLENSKVGSCCFLMQITGVSCEKWQTWEVSGR